MGVRRAHAVTDGRRLGQLARPSGVDAAQNPTVPIYVGCPTQLGGCELLSALQRPRAQAVTNAALDEFSEMTVLFVGSSELRRVVERKGRSKNEPRNPAQDRQEKGRLPLKEELEVVRQELHDAPGSEETRV